jgi:hypothetical protein
MGITSSHFVGCNHEKNGQKILDGLGININENGVARAEVYISFITIRDDAAMVSKTLVDGGLDGSRRSPGCCVAFRSSCFHLCLGDVSGRSGAEC